MLFLFLVTVVSAADIYVCSTGDGCNYSINSGAAMDNFTAAFIASNNTNNTLIINESGFYSINATAWNFNITDSVGDSVMSIISDNVTLDCNLSIINGSDSGIGIFINGRRNVTVQNCIIKNYAASYYVDSSFNITLYSDISESAGIGIYVVDSEYVSITDTNITDSSSDGIYLGTGASSTTLSNNIINNSAGYGINISGSSGNVFTGNTINSSTAGGLKITLSTVSDCAQNFSADGNLIDGKIVHFVYGESDTSYTPSGDIAYLGVVDSDNITLQGFTITGNLERALLVCNTTNSAISSINISGAPSTGIELFGTDDTNFTSCRVNSTQGNGFKVYSSDRNRFMANTVISNGLNGFLFNESANNTVTSANSITSNTQTGIYLLSSNFTTISDNTLNTNSVNGIYSLYSNNATIRNNTLAQNTQKGISLLLSSGVLLDDNNLIQNTNGDVLLNVSNATKVFNNSLTNIITNDAIGVYLLNSDSAVLFNNNFTTYHLEGLRVESSDSGNITSNTFLNVRNVTLSDSDSNYFVSNTINSSNTTGLIIISGSDSNTISSNMIRYNYVDGILLSSGSRANTLLNNTLSNNTGNGLKLLSSGNNSILNNTIQYNGVKGVELLNASSNNLTYNYISFNQFGVYLKNDPAASAGNNISYNDIISNTGCGATACQLYNYQPLTGVTADNNWWGSTWAYYVDNNSVWDDDESAGVVTDDTVDFCPLLNASIGSSGESVSCEYPSVVLSVNTTANIVGQLFTVSGVATDNYFSNCTYAIANASNLTQIWVNGSFDSVNKNFSVSYEGIYLPIGSWNFSANCSDQFSFSDDYLSSSLLTSVAGIVPTISGSSSATGTIGGSAVTFLFNVKAKGYKYVKFFMNLTSGVNVFDTTFASISNGSLTVNISGSPSYSGASSYNLSNASIPSTYFNVNGLYEDNLTLSIEPYTGLSAGTYAGTYGWGLFDS